MVMQYMVLFSHRTVALPASGLGLGLGLGLRLGLDTRPRAGGEMDACGRSLPQALA